MALAAMKPKAVIKAEDKPKGVYWFSCFYSHTFCLIIQINNIEFLSHSSSKGPTANAHLSQLLLRHAQISRWG